MRIAKLLDLGVQVTYAYEYVGEVGPERKRVDDKNKITDVKVSLTELEWCQMCMREGDHYIGGCCANASQIQDRLNDIFRDGGWVKAQDFRELAELFNWHAESGELFLKDSLTDEEFDNYLKSWSAGDLDVFDKIAVTWLTTKTKLFIKNEGPLRKHEDDFDQLVRDLDSSLRYFGWGSLLNNTESTEPEKLHREFKNQLALCRILPGLKALEQECRDHFKGPVDGFAITEANSDTICSNRLGLCIYGTQEKALEIVGNWCDNKPESKNQYTIRPVRISIDDGLTFRDK